LGKFGWIWSKFRQTWENLSKIWVKVINIWENLIGFGQNQNLAFPKTFNLTITSSWRSKLVLFFHLLNTGQNAIPDYC